MEQGFELSNSADLGDALVKCAQGAAAGQLKGAQVYIVALLPDGQFQSAIYTIGNVNLDYVLEAVIEHLKDRRKEEHNG